MIPVRIDTLMVGVPPSPSLIILRPLNDDAPEDERCVLPIWIGPTEAASIGVALEGVPNTRPMTHDLLANTIEALSGEIESVLISRVDGSTFYATVFLAHGDEMIEIDARPSDSIALAVRTSAPLYVDEQVMEDAAMPFMPSQFTSPREPRLREPKLSERIDEKEIEEFRAFIDSISPEDFASL